MKKIDLTHTYFCFRRTPFGSVGFLWVDQDGQAKIRRIFLPSLERSAQELTVALYPHATDLSCSEIDFLTEKLEPFLNGDAIRFSLDMVQPYPCSEFQQKVLRAEYGIPRESVSAYQRIARHPGSAYSARAFGTALAANPFPVIIPCHRAIRSDAALGGYQGGAEIKHAGFDF